jgi:hypothetical protein
VVQLGLEFRRQLGMGVNEVEQLRGILAQVVQLGARGVDILEAIVAHRTQLAPAIVVARVTRLGIGQDLVVTRSVHRVEQAPPPQSRGDRQSEKIEHRRHHIDETSQPLHVAALARPGCANDQRHAQGRVVEEDSVVRLPVLVESLTMVADDDDQRRIVELVLAEIGQ